MLALYTCTFETQALFDMRNLWGLPLETFEARCTGFDFVTYTWLHIPCQKGCMKAAGLQQCFFCVGGGAAIEDKSSLSIYSILILINGARMSCAWESI